MTQPKDFTLEEVQLVLRELISLEDAGGHRVTVAGIAAKLGVTRAAFYNAFPSVVATMAERRPRTASQPPTGQARRNRARTAEESLQTVRRERDELARELAAYAEEIRRVTVENSALRSALEQASDVPRIRQ